MLDQITQANPLESSKLELIYQNGDRIIVDFMPLIDQGGVFCSPRRSQVFSRVELGARGRYIAWEILISVRTHYDRPFNLNISFELDFVAREVTCQERAE